MKAVEVYAAFGLYVAVTLYRARTMSHKVTREENKLAELYHCNRSPGQVSMLKIDHIITSAGQRLDSQAAKENAYQEHINLKTIMMIRHGEAIHNVAERKVGEELWNKEESTKNIYLDAPLTQLGIEQSLALGRTISEAINQGSFSVDVIIVSPITRAIQTARNALAPIWDKVPIYAVEMCRERFGNCLSEKRRSLSELRKDFPRVNFDIFMEGEDDPWHNPKRETLEELEQRVHYFFEWLRLSQWKSVVIANHSAFIAATTKALGKNAYFAKNGELVTLFMSHRDE